MLSILLYSLSIGSPPQKKTFCPLYITLLVRAEHRLRRGEKFAANRIANHHDGCAVCTYSIFSTVFSTSWYLWRLWDDPVHLSGPHPGLDWSSADTAATRTDYHLLNTSKTYVVHQQ